MAEEEKKIDAAAEGRRIAAAYVNALGWAKRHKDRVAAQLVPARDQLDQLRYGDELENNADEQFGAEVDRLLHDGSKLSRAILEEIYRRIGKRADLSFFGKRIIMRIKESIHGY